MSARLNFWLMVFGLVILGGCAGAGVPWFVTVPMGAVLGMLVAEVEDTVGRA